jgi:hypothetical protein
MTEDVVIEEEIKLNKLLNRNKLKENKFSLNSIFSFILKKIKKNK